MVGKIGTGSYYKHCTQFHIQDFAKIAIMRFIVSFLIATYKNLFRIVIAVNQIHIVSRSA